MFLSVRYFISIFKPYKLKKNESYIWVKVGIRYLSDPKEGRFWKISFLVLYRYMLSGRGFSHESCLFYTKRYYTDSYFGQGLFKRIFLYE